MQRLTRPLLSVGLAALCVAPARAQWSNTALSEARSGTVAVTVNGWALFAGGRIGLNTSATVDVYEEATGTWSTTTLSMPRNYLTATVVGHLALFAGGSDTAGTCTDVVDVYDSSMGAPGNAAAWSTTALSQARWSLASTTVGNRAFFAGGALGGFNLPLGLSNVVDVYDASTNMWSTMNISHARAGIGATSLGSLAIFAGGLDFGGVLDFVDIYDDSTGIWSTARLSQSRILDAEASVTHGSRAYFGGGQVVSAPPTQSNRVDIYDSSIGAPDDPAAWSTASLSEPRGLLAAAVVGNTVLFAGGAVDGVGASNVVDVLNVTTGLWSVASPLSQARARLGVTTIGTKVIFAGGGGSGGGGGPSATVNIYEDAIGSSYCTPAVANSTGQAAHISAQGYPGSAAQGFVLLSVRQLPLGSNGYFLNSMNQGFLANAGASQGTLCLSGSIGRYSGQVFVSSSAGQVTLQLDLANTPTPLGAVAISAGQTWNFQAWYRDSNPGSTSNFTDALTITFQ